MIKYLKQYIFILLFLLVPSMALGWGLVGKTGVSGSYGLIGTANTAGFGVGVCPGNVLPSGMTPLSRYSVKTSDNYGNYQFEDGSVMVFIPKFYYKISTNTIDIKGTDTYATTAAANTAGYALHRAFIDGDAEKTGFFVDKYMCSKNAKGGGYVASSIADALALSIHADHNPIADLTACSSNNYYQAINAAHARDGVNGAVNASSIFHVTSRFQQSALAMLSVAHGQAASDATYCAWYHATYNYPKGCNNNALGDTNDGTVSYTTDGYSNCGKTGSGTPFAKTTHNGQACGVADLNGLMWEVNIGATCITAGGGTIEDITRADPASVQITGHNRITGDQVMLKNIEVGDWAALDDKLYTITRTDDDNFTLTGVDSSGFGDAYVAGTNHGTITAGTFYAAKQATAMSDFTSGNSGATDHWGATGAAAMMDAFTPAFETGYSANGFAQRFGSGANQVLAEDTSGADWLLTGLGFPKDADGMDTTGTNLFGKDYFYQYVRNELCFRSGGDWSNHSLAGVWSVYWVNVRTDSYDKVGFRAACYPD